MRWTPAEDGRFRALAAAGHGSAIIAEWMTKPLKGVRRYASLHGISISAEPKPKPRPEAAALRARWATLIGPMKERLRAEIKREMSA